MKTTSDKRMAKEILDQDPDTYYYIESLGFQRGRESAFKEVEVIIKDYLLTMDGLVVNRERDLKWFEMKLKELRK